MAVRMGKIYTACQKHYERMVDVLRHTNHGGYEFSHLTLVHYQSATHWRIHFTGNGVNSPLQSNMGKFRDHCENSQAENAIIAAMGIIIKNRGNFWFLDIHSGVYKYAPLSSNKHINWKKLYIKFQFAGSRVESTKRKKKKT